MKKWIINKELYAEVARKAQAEGAVLLENRDNALPLPAGSRVALFGRSQYNYYKSGTGSGGMVNTRYVTGVKEALEGAFNATITYPIVLAGLGLKLELACPGPRAVEDLLIYGSIFLAFQQAFSKEAGLVQGTCNGSRNLGNAFFLSAYTF